jgi:uncharacterized protein YfaS (alpha-2-macroglobulin family)
MLTGDRTAWQALVPRSFGEEKAEPMTGGSFGSYTRDLALSLNAILEADPNNPQVGTLMKDLYYQLKEPNRYYTTQENAFALLAIGKQARRAAATNLTAQVSIDWKQAGTFQNKDIVLTNDMLNRNISISASGTGTLYYFYELSGIGTSLRTGSEDHGLKVRKRFFDRNGNEISGNSFIRNDLVVVEVTVEALSGLYIDNVAITDLLPACFEIENSRLVAEREMAWIRDKSIADYTDIRDDRISFFTRVDGKPAKFYYTVRVVGKGAFAMGPVRADAMYRGEYNSYSGGRLIEVQK